MNYHERGEADIYVARIILSPVGNPTNDENVYAIAAYHVQQAIEKELKYILHDLYQVDDSTRSFKTYNISDLIGQVERLGIALPDELIELAYDIGDWEAATRYAGNVVADAKEIKNAIDIYDLFASFVKDQIQGKLQAEE